MRLGKKAKIKLCIIFVAVAAFFFGFPIPFLTTDERESTYALEAPTGLQVESDAVSKSLIGRIIPMWRRDMCLNEVG